MIKKWIGSWAQGFEVNGAQTESNSLKNAAIQN